MITVNSNRMTKVYRWNRDKKYGVRIKRKFFLKEEKLSIIIRLFNHLAHPAREIAGVDFIYNFSCILVEGYSSPVFRRPYWAAGNTGLVEDSVYSLLGADTGLRHNFLNSQYAFLI